MHISDIDKPENRNWLYVTVCEKIEELNTHPKFGFDTIKKMEAGEVWLRYIVKDGYVDMVWTGI